MNNNRIPLPATNWFKIKLPTSGRNIHVRPFKLKEQKVLIRYKDEEQGVELYKELMKLVQTCIKEDNIKVTELYPIDFQSIFFQIRSFSDGDVTKFLFKYDDDEGNEKEQELVVDIKEDIEYDKKELTLEIPVDLENGKGAILIEQLKMKDVINISNMSNKDYSDEEKSTKTLAYTLKKIKTSDDTFDPTLEEAETFLDNLEQEATTKIMKFLEDKPSFVCKKEYNLIGREKPKIFTKDEVEHFLFS